MSIIDQIKDYVARQKLKKELSGARRTSSNVSLREAKAIGILYSISDEASSKIVQNFLKSLKEEGRTVISMGYIHEKKIPTFLHQSVYNSIICQSDLNWYKKPVNQYVNNFFKEDFDIFINISLDDYYPLHYISAIAHAHMKVGRYHEKYLQMYDLMMKVDDGIPQDQYINDIIRYIEMINNNAHAK